MDGKGVGLSGIGMASIAAGAYFIYAGIRNVPILEGLRELASGRLPVGRPPTITEIRLLPRAAEAVGSAAGTAAGAVGGAGAEIVGGAAGLALAGSLNARIAADVRRYLGVPYRLDGATPAGFDCSGLVTWVLHHDLGLSLPNNTHTVTGQFLTWSGAITVPRDQCIAGDLVCWPGHIGIATDRDNMIAAPHIGTVVRPSGISSIPPPTIRRVKG